MDSKKFPKGFLWGTATAAHQIEGNNTNNDWWEWEQRHKIDKSGQACNSYDLYKEDLKLIKKLNSNTYRLSLEWSRIEPEPGVFDVKELAHYREVLSELKENGIKTFLTLHHFTSPLWFKKMGGFEKKENLKYFREYVERCSEEFGSLVDFWVPINEPNTYVSEGYIYGHWPPGKRNIFLALRVFKNLADAHRLAYDILHKHKHSLVGTAINTGVIYPSTKFLLDRKIAEFGNWLWNDLDYFLIGDKIDFLGINYYFSVNVSIHNFLEYFRHPASTRYLHMKGSEKYGRTDNNWPIFPEGIYDAIMSRHKKYRKPIFITENGLADLSDTKRPQFINDHLKYVHQAIADGAGVLGYIHWSLMDNFEWASGFGARFGLFETNYKTLSRTPRKSAELFSKICEYNSLEQFISEYVH